MHPAFYPHPCLSALVSGPSLTTPENTELAFTVCFTEGFPCDHFSKERFWTLSLQLSLPQGALDYQGGLPVPETQHRTQLPVC